MRFFALLALVALSHGVQMNPIRRVVSLLQNLGNKVAAEADTDKALNDKFACYCKTNNADLAKSIDDNKENVQQLESSVKEVAGKKAQTAKELEQHKADRADTTKAIDTATALRNKDNASFNTESTELKNNIEGLGKAVSALERGMTGFLQTNSAASLRRVFIERADSLGRTDRELLGAFLQGSSEYAPSSGEIVGILKTMQQDMQKDLAGITKTEDQAAAAHNDMVAAQEREMEAATKAIEEKTARVGELSVQEVNLKNDFKDTQDLLKENTEMARKLKEDCSVRAAEYDQRQKMRTEEQAAIASTIKVLNDDSALDLFKKTLPSPSLIQMGVSSKSRARRAMAILSNAKAGTPSAKSFSFIMLALRGKKVGFEKVTKMIDAMVNQLEKDQDDNEAQKGYCEKEITANERKARAGKRTLKGQSTQISENQQTISATKEEIAALKTGIDGLDAAVAEATGQRKKEHSAAVKEQADNNTAIQLLDWAKNNLNKFYNPKLYVAPAPEEMTEEERVYQAMGGESAPTPPPGGIGGTGISLLQVRQAPSTGSYNKKSEESTGIISMIEKLKQELQLETQQSESDENTAQKEYEGLMETSSAKREADSKTITEKAAQLAGSQTELQKNKEERRGTLQELTATSEVVSKLHGECDHLLKNFGAISENIKAEVDALQKSKAVLSGADYA